MLHACNRLLFSHCACMKTVAVFTAGRFCAVRYSRSRFATAMVRSRRCPLSPLLPPLSAFLGPDFAAALASALGPRPSFTNSASARLSQLQQQQQQRQRPRVIHPVLAAPPSPPPASRLTDHLAAAGRPQRQRQEWRTWRVGEPSSPRSPIDWLLLQACRCAADYVVTSGENLRREAGLRVELDPSLFAANHGDQQLERQHESPMPGPLPHPTPVLLTRGADLASLRTQPFFHGPRPPLIFSRWPEAGCASANHPEHAATRTLSDVLQELHRHHQQQQQDDLHGEPTATTTISIEAGPSTVRALYEESSHPPPDVLVMTEYEPSDSSTSTSTSNDTTGGGDDDDERFCETGLPVDLVIPSPFRLSARASVCVGADGAGGTNEGGGGGDASVASTTASPGKWTFSIFERGIE